MNLWRVTFLYTDTRSPSHRDVRATSADEARMIVERSFAGVSNIETLDAVLMRDTTKTEE